MKSMFSPQLALCLGVSALAVVVSSWSVQAQPVDASATNSAQLVPVPGTIPTSVAALSPDGSAAPLLEPTAETAADVAQLEPAVQPGTVTRGGLNYLGVGGFIGTDTGFAITSKIGLTTDLSVRPSAVIEDDVTFRIPLTYEFFPIGPDESFVEGLRLTPYIGGGIVLTTDDNADVGALVTAGLDFPLGPQFTGTANVNVDFRDSVEAGVIIGFGYNFAGL